MALDQSIAALAAIKASIKTAITERLTNPGDHFADYAGYIRGIGDPDVTRDYETAQAVLKIGTNRVGRVHFSQTVAGGVTVNWGDGHSETSDTVGEVTLTHAYSFVGVYKISISIAAGAACTLMEGAMCARYADTTQVDAWTVRQVYVPYNFGLGSNAFRGFAKAEIEAEVRNFPVGCFAYCKNLNISGLSSSYYQVAGACFENSGVNQRYYLIGDVGGYAFEGAAELPDIVFPSSGAVTIGYAAFRNCLKLCGSASPNGRLTLPAGVTYIGGYAFAGCFNVKTIKILATTPPTLGTDAFETATLTKIYVPAGTLAAYQAATNWAAYASLMEETS